MDKMAVLPPVMTAPNSSIALHSSALDSGMINSTIKDPVPVSLCLAIILPVGIVILTAVFVLVIMENLRQRKKASQGRANLYWNFEKFNTGACRIHRQSPLHQPHRVLTSNSECR